MVAGASGQSPLIKKPLKMYVKCHGCADATTREHTLLPGAALGVRVHVGPIQLLFHPVEGIVADDTARAQLDELLALGFRRSAQRLHIGRVAVGYARFRSA